MKLVILKLAETLARALFVFVCMYSLPIEQSGQFGILTTMIGLFAFAFGYERHIDIQRRYADSPSELFDTVVAKAFRLYGFNYLLLLPFFVLGGWLWSQLELIFALACVVIVVSEHVSNKTYNLSLVNTRYHNLLILTVTKNVITSLIVIYWVFLGSEQLQLTEVIQLWMSTSLICSLLMAVGWFRINETANYQGTEVEKLSIWQSIKQQFKLSYNHFMIGLFAIVSLQLDRIMAGSLLSLEDAGLYFRHVTLVAIIYQFFNIASYNRVLPHVYGNAQKETSSSLLGRTRREYVKVFFAAILLYCGFLAIYVSPFGHLYDKYQVDVSFLAIFLVTFVIRAGADFNGLVYNAKRKEKYLLRYQMVALAVGVCAFVSLTLSFGIVGTVVAGSFGASCYLILTKLNFKILDQKLELDLEQNKA